MKKLVVALIAIATLALVSTAQASITNAWWDADGDGVLECSTTSWDPITSTLWMEGAHCYDTAGHMEGLIQTDTPLDPTLTLSGSVQNQTSFAWIGYQIKIRMSVPWNWTTPGPTIENPPLYDWFITSQAGPWHIGGGIYEGIFDYSSGTPVGVGETLNWLYSIDFSGGLNIQFTQEMIPWSTQIPEPGSLALVGLGGLMLVHRLRRNRRA